MPALAELPQQRDLSMRNFNPADFVMPVIDYSRRVEGRRPLSVSKDALIAEDIWEHGQLQNKFDAVLGRKYDSKDMLTRSYNPVTDRWRIEKLRRFGDKEGEASYRKEIDRNIETNLRERLQVGENVVTYRIIGNELYSQDFLEEPFSDVLKRGIEYRLTHGTQEAEREAGELEGWRKVQKKLADANTPVGTKMTVFSPPGMVEDSAYDRQLVDEYELVEGRDGRSVKLTRRIVDFDTTDYAKTAHSLDFHYFDRYDERPLDAWFLSHPIEGTLADLKIKGMSSSAFDKIYQSPLLQGIIQEYLGAITAENVDWRQVALTINAIYNQVDAEEKAVLSDTGKTEQQLYISQDAIRSKVQMLGMQTPAERGGAGCPTSKGYDGMSNLFSTGSFNSVSSYGGKVGGISGSCPEIKCPCGWKASESEVASIQAGTITRCPVCDSPPGRYAPNEAKKEEPDLAA